MKKWKKKKKRVVSGKIEAESWRKGLFERVYIFWTQHELNDLIKKAIIIIIQFNFIIIIGKKKGKINHRGVGAG